MKHVHRRKKTRDFFSPGFTIVELLIVIVVIGVLVSLVVTAYAGMQGRSKYAKVRDAITKVDKAFKLKAVQDGKYQQDEYYIICSNEPLDPAANNQDLQTTISQCNDTYPLKKYISNPTQFSYDPPHELTWFYDNDLDTFDYSCTEANRTMGVNIQMPYAGAAIVQRLDTDIDKGDGRLCGQIRWGAATPDYGYYMIAPNSTAGL